MRNKDEKLRLKEIIKEAEESLKRQSQVPESKRIHLGTPKKWDFPIGLDDEGNPFPVDQDKVFTAFHNGSPIKQDKHAFFKRWFSKFSKR